MANRQTYQDNGSLLVSRRAFLYGAAATGAAAALGMGLTGCGAFGGGDDEPASLKVPESSLVTLNDFEVLDSPEGHLQQLGQFDLPYGTLVWATDDNVAACLLPTDAGSPLTQVGLLFLDSGMLNMVMNRAIGFAEHFEVYDVRACSSGIIWTEANILEGTWRIYTAQVAGDSISGAPVMVEEGNSTYDTPMLAVASNKAFWQVVPKQPNDDNLPSRLMAATFGRDDASCVYESEGRMKTPPYSAGDSVTIVPRINLGSTYCQLTNINASTGAIEDILTLPAGMSPLEAGYGKHGFMFSFADIYNYGEGISNLGTYTPIKAPSGDYNAVNWFGFARTPTAAPAWCNDLLIVKSSFSVCGVDLNQRVYFAIDVDDGTDDYGDYLASSGTHGKFVTFSNIDHQPIGATPIHACRVKVWTAL